MNENKCDRYTPVVISEYPIDQNNIIYRIGFGGCIMYNDDLLVNGESARMLSRAYESFAQGGHEANVAVTEGEAKSIIAEMCSKCLSRQKKATLDSIARLLTIYPDPPSPVHLNGYYDGMNKLYCFVNAKLNTAISERQDIELPLTLAVMLLLSEKHTC